MKKRLCSIVLSVAMLLSLLPTMALADDSGAPADGQAVFAVEETIPVSGLSGEVTIGGYMKDTDWYVTDGLVLMYDGIYNAGMNQTETNPSTWKELTGKGDGYALPLAIDSSNSDNGWKNNGYYHITGTSGKTLPEAIALDNNAGYTIEFAFDRNDASDWVEPRNYKPLVQFDYTEVSTHDETTTELKNQNPGAICKDSIVLFYGTNYTDGGNYYFGSGGAVNGFSTRTFVLKNEATAIKRGYENGTFYRSNGGVDGFDTKADKITAIVPKILIPAYTIVTKAAVKDGSTVISPAETRAVGHTTYGIRVYNKPLTDAEIAQNYAVDQARYVTNTYVTPGTVAVGSAAAAALTECTFDASGVGHVGQTTVNVSSGDTLNLTLNREGEYTLTFKQENGDLITKAVKVISKTAADAADTVADQINALPAADALTLDNLDAVAAAQTKYNALSEVQKERVGTTAKAKLDACVASMDELAQADLSVDLTYNVNGGTLPEGTDLTVSVKYKGSEATQLAVPTRKNFRFDGWYLGETPLTGSDAVLQSWTALQGAEITAHWTNNTKVDNASLEITEAGDIYALARILSCLKWTGSKYNYTQSATDLTADYARFGLTVSEENCRTLQSASYVLKNGIALDDQSNSFYGIPNFKGTFDGNSNTISVNFNLNASWGNQQFGCLFSSLDGGTLKDVSFTGTVSGTVTSTSGLQDVAVAAGYTKNGATIQNVTSSVAMTNLTFTTSATDTCVYVGAFVGRASGGTDKLINCVNNGALTVTFTGYTANGGCRLGGLVGHAYSGVTFDKCENNGNIDSSTSNTVTLTGGMVGSGSRNRFTDCVLSADVNGGSYAVGSYASMSADSTGNVMLAKVTGTAGQVIAYTGDASQTATLTGENPTATIRIPVESKDGLMENNAFSYAQYLTVDGKRLDWFTLDNTKLTLKLNATAATNLDVPFQSESDALVLKTEQDLLNLQKALSSGDEDAIRALYTLGGKTFDGNVSMAKAALETGYYKLGNDITVTSPAFTGIGTQSAPFSGHFDGQGNTVTLQNNPTLTGGDYGLFGYVNTGANGAPVIENLNVVANTAITSSGSNTYAGALAGRLYTGELKNVTATVKKLTATGALSNNSVLHLGALIGLAVPSSVSNVSAVIDGPLTVETSAHSIYLGGGFGSCVLPGPISVTYNEGAELKATNQLNGTENSVCIGALLGYNASGNMDLRGSTLTNTSTAPLVITATSNGTINAGGWVGQITDATAAADKWFYVDKTTVMSGPFAVNATSSYSQVYAGGILGSMNQSYSVSVKDYVNKTPVTGKYVGGLIGGASNGSSEKTILVENCLNLADLTGSTDVGGLIGFLNPNGAATIKNSANSGALSGSSVGGLVGSVANGKTADYENALYVKTASVTKGVGILAADPAGVIALDATKLTSATFDTPVENVLSAAAPDALTVSGNAALSGANLTFTAAGDQEITFLWNGSELYTAPVAVAAKDLTGAAGITYTGISSSYASVEAAQADADKNLRLAYSGKELVKGTDYEVTAENGHFTITFKGNYAGTANLPYTINASFTATADSVTAVYDGQAHGITVNVTDGATVTYSASKDGTYDAAQITRTDVGETTVYWKATKDGQTDITGSAVITVTKADQSISYAAASVTKYVGEAPFINDLTKTSVFGDIAYTSSDNSVAAVDATGKVTIVGAGTATITATAAGSANYNEASASYTLTVRYPYAPVIPGSSVSVPATANGSVTVSPSTASKGTTVTVTTKPNEGYVLGSLEVLDKDGNALALKDLGSGKYSFTMPDGKVTVNASFVKASASTGFADVPADAFYADAVKWAVDKGVTNGLSDTLFGPYEPCTRAQIVTFLWRAAGSPEPKATTSQMTDLDPNAYYYKAVLWAIENGITDGMTDTTFAPNATCTRGQSVTFLYRALGKKASGSASFSDVAANAFYADAVNWAVESSVTNGTSATTFSPNADCTRAEIVTFLYRAYQGK